MMEIKGDYFNNNFHLAKMSGTSAVEQILTKTCPANLDQKLWICPIEPKHVDRVSESASSGFKVWKKLTQTERNNYLKEYQKQLIKRRDDIAKAIAYETGKPLWESYTEADSVINKIDVTINDSLPKIKTETYENISHNTNAHVYYKPIGPCLIIGPFNFPCHLANGQITSCLIAGNSIIFKPSEKTIYSAQILIECFHEAKFPMGVVNLINGTGEIAQRLLEISEIKGVYFTGSKETAERITKITYKDFTKLVALEMGGKNTSIVHDDAHFDFAIRELINASFLSAGQRCTSNSKIAIHHKIKDKFIEKFHDIAKKLIVDHPIEHEKEPFMGPLIDERALENYLTFMGMAKREGHEEIMRGKALTKKFRGHYVSPSIHFTDKLNPKSLFLTTEIFGPNCLILPYNEIEEAIEIANFGEYGLATSVFTRSKDIFNKCIQEIDSGLLNFNKASIGASAKLPFGGIKNSGNYRPAGSVTISTCVYPMSSIETADIEAEKVDLTKIKGLN